MNSDNNWYGHRFILREYCKIENDLPIFGFLQHGCHFKEYLEYFTSTGVRKFSFYPYFCWDKETEIITKKRGVKNVHSIGAPFLYLMKMYESALEIKQKKKNNGTVYFQEHSTPESDYFFNSTQKKIIEKIENENPGPYTVCLFYSDLKEDIINFYKKRNWNIHCCGSRSDNFTLFKVYELINNSEKCIFTYFSTPFFYSMILKKRTQIIPDDFKFFKKGVKDSFYKSHMQKYPSLFESEIDLEEGYIYAKKYLGLDSMKEPDELKHILGWNSSYKKILSKFSAAMIDFKYSKDYRLGNKLEEKYLKKTNHSWEEN
tara:strand:- start:17489 stop:18436 length:948 start_codon:yes stop_codon:yes gene_type:complete